MRDDTMMVKVDWRFVMVSAIAGAITGIVLSCLGYPKGKML